MKLFSTAIILLVSLFHLAATLFKMPPRTVKQPSTNEVFGRDDDIFFLECEATGSPTPKYRWIKDGKPFNWEDYEDRISQQLGRGGLIFQNIQDSDIGLYQCFAENELGVATSNSFFLRRSTLGLFKNTNIFSLSGNEGEPFKIHCDPPDGYPKPTLYWLIQYSDGRFKSINDSRITVDPEGTLWFSSLTRYDITGDFTYACAASSATKLEYQLGNRVSLSVIPSGKPLPKHAPALQYATRPNEAAIRGKVVVLFCIFGGTPVPQIEWSKNGNVIEQSDRVLTDNYGKTLIIKLVDFHDSGTYICRADNGVGKSQARSINLHVLALPYFTTEPEFVNAATEETADISCVAAGVPNPEIKWLHNGKPIEEAPLNPRRTVEQNRIIIENLTIADIGNYGCNATNALGYIYKDVFINVLALPPEFIESLSDTQVLVGKDISLSCRVFGVPKPNIKWFHNNSELDGGRFTVSQQNSDLHIKNVNFEDAGQYKCLAENRYGEETAELTLAIKAPVQIIKGPNDIFVGIESSATFNCTVQDVEGLPTEITWLHRGQIIDFESELRFVKTTDNSLSISKVNMLDAGRYTCVARNELSEDAATATLWVVVV